MFYMQVPKTMKIGDTQDCRINAEPARITWRDANTLVIEPNDARPILHTRISGDLRIFTCGNADTGRDVTVEEFPGGGFIVEAP